MDQLVPTLLSNLTGVMEAVLDDIADGASREWGRLATQRLGDSRQDYIDGIQPVEAEKGIRIISLVGKMPNYIENGMDPYDMRDTLLSSKSRLRRVNAKGQRYGHVPFRHSTPTSGGAVGVPMGRAYGPTGAESRGLGGKMGADAAKDMGKAIYAIAKRLKATRSHTTTSSRSGGSISETAWGGRLKAGDLAPKLAEHHTASIFEGMVRVRHAYATGQGTQYMTWRTISESNPEGWRHPGIEARNIARDVESWIHEKGPRIAANVLAQALKAGAGR